MVILVDDQVDLTRVPTRSSIPAGMQWLVHDAQDNDSHVYHFSEHVGLMKELDSD
jgi:hypothetical protein